MIYSFLLSLIDMILCFSWEWKWQTRI